MEYIWYFFGYGFLGYLFEKAFARVTKSAHQVRKGCLLMPICPVYGLAMVAILVCGAERIESFGNLMIFGAVIATTVEYMVHWGYEALFSVYFWDYSDTKMDIGGRICLPFSLVWGLLSATAVRFIQPVMQALAVRIPTAVTDLVLVCFAIDLMYSARVLLLYGDIELLAPSALRRREKRMA